VVICLKEGRHALPQNVRVISLGKERGRISRIRYALRFIRAIWKERAQYDAVFVHMNPEYVLLGGLFWRLWNKFVVLWYAHGSVTLRLHFAVMWAHCVVTSSAAGMRIDTPKRVVVGQGIDTEQFAPRTPQEAHPALRLITVGRISARKHLEHILPALDVLAARDVPFTYTIVGAPATPHDIAYEARLHAEIAKRPYADQILFAGVITHDALPDELRQADVFVNLSQTGSMDKVVLEALSCEIPVLSANSAYAALLTPYDLYLNSTDANVLADRLVRAKTIPVHALRALIQRDHSLATLIPKILAVYPQ
jgi:glycosyltransferase involved in cell wall biosynthesis